MDCFPTNISMPIGPPCEVIPGNFECTVFSFNPSNAIEILNIGSPQLLLETIGGSVRIALNAGKYIARFTGGIEKSTLSRIIGLYFYTRYGIVTTQLSESARGITLVAVNGNTRCISLMSKTFTVNNN